MNIIGGYLLSFVMGGCAGGAAYAFSRNAHGAAFLAAAVVAAGDLATCLTFWPR